MKSVIKEYASSVVAFISTILFFLITERLLFSSEGILAKMIAQLGGSGIG